MNYEIEVLSLIILATVGNVFNIAEVHVSESYIQYDSYFTGLF
jgi:hypothetical protein